MNNIALFTYDFEHKKSLDFFNIIVKDPSFNVTVIAAPWVNIENSSLTTQPIQNSPVKDFCKKHYIPYISCKHNDVTKIKSAVDKYKLTLGIIAGARIIPKSIIEIFDDGIVNFHPGKIPESSGLDALYHTIRNNSVYGVTSHFIDYRVDAGDLIDFKEVSIDPNDTITSLKEKNYNLQLEMLNDFLIAYQNEEINRKPIIRPFKNNALSESEKHDILKNFEIWKTNHYLLQYNSKIYKACEDGDLVYLKSLNFPKYIISLVNDKGWSPLLVAAFHQRIELCEWLIENGADTNFQNPKGTSVLMFAKTNANGKTDLLSLLLSKGANPYLKDCFGNDIFYYLKQKNQLDIIDFLKENTI